jgi:hypothetical protein
MTTETQEVINDMLRMEAERVAEVARLAAEEAKRIAEEEEARKAKEIEEENYLFRLEQKVISQELEIQFLRDTLDAIDEEEITVVYAEPDRCSKPNLNKETIVFSIIGFVLMFFINIGIFNELTTNRTSHEKVVNSYKAELHACQEANAEATKSIEGFSSMFHSLDSQIKSLTK